MKDNPSEAAMRVANRWRWNGIHVETLAQAIDEEFAPAIEFIRKMESGVFPGTKKQQAQLTLEDLGIPLEDE